MGRIEIAFEPLQADDPTVLARLSGSLDGDSSTELQRRLHELAEKGTVDAVVDLGGVDFVNSTGLAGLVRAAEQFRSEGGGMALINVSPKVGTVIEIQGLVLHRSQAYLVTGLCGTPLGDDPGPWVEALLGFAQVDDAGRPAALPDAAGEVVIPDSDVWRRLHQRLQKLLKIR